jgi:hypothetical protein
VEIPDVVNETILIFGQIANRGTGEFLEAPAMLPSTWNKIAPAVSSVHFITNAMIFICV